MVYNYLITAGYLLKNKLVFFFLCSRRGARKSLNHGRSSLRHCSQSAAWMDGAERVKDPL